MNKIRFTFTKEGE